MHTNPAPVAVQGITTASYNNWPSTCRPQGQNAEAFIDTLALSDIACPTWGLSDPFTTSCDGSSYLTETYGAPYNPVILVPTELVSIDPAWAACTTNTAANAFLTLPCGIYDPPRALSTKSALVPEGASGENLAPFAVKQTGGLAPGVTSANDPSAPTMTAAAPANAGSPSLPKPTTVAISGGSDPSEEQSQDGSDSNEHSDPAAGVLKLDPLAPSSTQSDDPSQNNPVQQGVSSPASDSTTSDPNSPGSSSSEDPADSESSNSGSDTSDHPSQDGSEQKEAPDPVSGSQSSDPNEQPAVPQAVTTINLDSGASTTQGVGALINGGLGGGSVPAPPPAFTPHAITALGQTLSITDPSAVAIGSSKLSVGGPAHISDGKYYSLAPSGNLIAGTLAPSPEPSPPLVLSVAGSVYTANSASEFVIASQTLTHGGVINVANTPVSLYPSADVALVGGTTQVLSTPPPITYPAVMKFAGATYTANAASEFVIAGQTLPPGGQIFVSSTRLSLAPSANFALIGTSTQLLTTPSPTSNPAAILTFAGSTYTANSASQFIIAGQTLTSGGTITASGTTISLPEGTNVALIGTSTQTLATAPAPTVSTDEAPVLTFEGSTYTADASSDFVIASQTLTPGGVITVLGTPISLEPGASDAVVGSSTQSLAMATITPADIITVGGEIVTASPTGFAVEGMTVLPGGKGVLVNGTLVSLAPGGTIVVGNSTKVLPTEGPKGTGLGGGVFEGGQGRLRAMGMGMGWVGLFMVLGMGVGGWGLVG